ncbi:chloroplast envelope quinone oxidoreductase homolog [Telopea speciosissima]|uniref:chloroplast envelope quinone oxidoreductase homolog n=1 Tax=Telopea speciosissima TaxID=54955 RepID=UPI001CC41A36|nr:chloroplast envelope quinone oxidoreductase homolog [Telopea speciosissima]
MLSSFCFHLSGKTMAGKVMKAVQINGYGGGVAGLKHVEVPVPAPKKDEVLVKVEARSINPVDWRIQKGKTRPIIPSKFPYIPALDIAGEVVEVGSGVKNFKAGDKVVAVLSMSTGGGLAEFAVAKGSLTVNRPTEVSAAEGAGLPIAGLTALQALTQSCGIKLDSSGKPTNVLITAASGGVGHYAVQLAKLGNTHVTATCGARNIEFVKSLGADEVLDYKTPDGAALKSPSGRKYDAVIHCATGIPWSTFEPNLSEQGKVIDITPSPSAMLTFAVQKLTFSKKQLLPLIVTTKGENLEFLVKLVKEGKLKTVVDSKHPLSKAEDAWAKSMDGHATGKVIVEP